jgi:hypothetical protein
MVRPLSRGKGQPQHHHRRSFRKALILAGETNKADIQSMTITKWQAKSNASQRSARVNGLWKRRDTKDKNALRTRQEKRRCKTQPWEQERARNHVSPERGPSLGDIRALLIHPQIRTLEPMTCTRHINSESLSKHNQAVDCFSKIGVAKCRRCLFGGLTN